MVKFTIAVAAAFGSFVGLKMFPVTAAYLDGHLPVVAAVVVFFLAMGLKD